MADTIQPSDSAPMATSVVEAPTGLVGPLLELDHHLAAQTELALDGKRSDFDIDDESDRAVVAHFPGLAQALEFLQAELNPRYRPANAEAIRYQDRYRRLARVSIVSGIAAILLAVTQLVLGSVWPSLVRVGLVLEALAVVAGIGAVVVGVGARWNARWLSHRQLAERIRILKFRALGRFDLWGDAADDWRRWVRQELAETVLCESIDKLHEWTKRDTSEVDDPAGLRPVSDVQTAAAVAVYYRHKRLAYQAGYFRSKAAQAIKVAASQERLKFPLFVSTVGCVVVHVAVDLGAGLGALDGLPGGDHLWHAIASCALGLAAMLPVVGVGVRMWVAAFELGRRARTFPAKAQALDRAICRLDRDRSDPAQVIRRIRNNELFLEQEHREWLRLQLDAEWFV